MSYGSIIYSNIDSWFLQYQWKWCFIVITILFKYWKKELGIIQT
jgi:hypothetical protein